MRTKEVLLGRGRLLAAGLLILTSLYGCGGGGSSGDLEIDFSYYDTVASAHVASTFKANLSGLEGNDPSCRIVEGELPAGFKLNKSNCVISGTAEETGSFHVTVRLTVDGFKGHIDTNVPISIMAPQLVYPVTGDTQAWGEPIDPVAPQWDGFEPTEGDVVVYSKGEDWLPGLEIDATTGVISGMPTPDRGVWGGSKVKVSITRNGHTVEAEASFAYSIAEPIIAYPEQPAEVGKDGQASPVLPAALKGGGWEVSFGASVGSGCQTSNETIDPSTGEVRWHLNGFSGTCSLEFDWHARKGEQALFGMTFVTLVAP